VMSQTLSPLASLSLASLLSTALFLPPADASDQKRPAWPEFLGPERNGISRETGLNLNWEATPPKVLWKVPLGSGYGSFAVVGDRLFTMARRGQRDFVLCLDAGSGKEVWAHDAAPTYVDKQKQGSGPRATPTYHRGKLYCLLPMGELICLSAADGRKLWEQDTFKDVGARNPAGGFFYWGESVSPLVAGDLVIVQPGGRKDNSVAAFHKDTGELVWTAGDDGPGYGSPILITVAGRQQVVCPTGMSLLGLDPVKGGVLWRVPFGNKFNANCANPVWAEDTLFMSAAYGVGSIALEIVPKEGGWEARERWRSRKNLQTLFCTSIIQDGHIYGCSGDLSAIFLRCLDLKTGDILWEERLPGRSTLLGVEGHLLILDERGSLQLVEMNPKEFRPKGTMAELLTYKAWAAPALAGGKLYLRDEHSAVCLDLRRP
jgi:outer membrane protein assembly factor BamB